MQKDGIAIQLLLILECNLFYFHFVYNFTRNSQNSHSQMPPSNTFVHTSILHNKKCWTTKFDPDT
jgi:hypothetical protein